MIKNSNKGKYVLRSTYQKKCEENKKLLADIKVLTADGINADAILLRAKWNKKFKLDKEFNNLLQAACLQYLGENPQFLIPHKRGTPTNAVPLNLH